MKILVKTKLVCEQTAPSIEGSVSTFDDNFGDEYSPFKEKIEKLSKYRQYLIIYTFVEWISENYSR